MSASSDATCPHILTDYFCRQSGLKTPLVLFPQSRPFSLSSAVRLARILKMDSSRLLYMVQQITCAHILEVGLENAKTCLPWLTVLSLLLGTGNYKVGANYAVTIFPQKKAAELGYASNLWLHGPEHNLTEVCK
jgi:hypothetical protein